MMAATGMVLAGQAANATTTVTQSPTTQADSAGQGLPLDLQRLPDGNSGATCGGGIGGINVNLLGFDAGLNFSAGDGNGNGGSANGGLG